MTAEESADWWRDQANRRADECQQLTAEVNRLRAELAEQTKLKCALAELERITQITGAIKHTNAEECYGCGCMSMTAEECVIYMMRELAAAKKLNEQLAERLHSCSQVLSRAAERGKVCKCQMSPAELVLSTQ